MANTYTQLYIHHVFTVKFRKAIIQPEWDERLRLYITAIVQNNGHKMIAINNVYDHLLFFAGLNPNQANSDLLRLVKGDSSEWINKEKSLPENSIGKMDMEHLAIRVLISIGLQNIL